MEKEPKYRPTDKRLHRVALQFIQAISPRLRPRTQERYTAAINATVVALGPMDIDAVTGVEISRAFSERLKTIGHGTAGVELRVLRAFLQWCVTMQLIVDNPMDRIRAKDLGVRNEPWRLRWLEPDEWDALMRVTANDEFMRDAIVFAAATGLRWENQFRLKREQLMLDKREVFIPTKDYKTWHNIVLPMDDDAMAAVQRRLAYIQTAKRAHQGWFVFGYIDKFDECLRPYKDLDRRFKNLLERAGIEDFTWHDFRHDRACQLVQSGVDLLPTSKLMGHASIKSTLRYAALRTQNLHETVNKHREKLNAKRTTTSV